MPLAMGLFHRSDAVRNAVIEILDSLQQYQVRFVTSRPSVVHR